MVVIKENRMALSGLYGDDFIKRLDDFSGIIGYTLELEDQEVKVEFNPDRPDLFSFTSLNHAMEIYSGQKTWKPLKFSRKEIDFNIDHNVRKLRPYTIGFTCKGSKIGEHFRDLIDYQERIHASVGKDRSKVSIGIHDIKDLKTPLRYSAYRSDEITFRTYDGEVEGTAREILNFHPKGKEYAHLLPSYEEVPIIEDSSHRVLSMPPVINGDTTAVSKESSSFFIDITGTDPKALRDSFYLLAYYFSDLGYEIALSEFGDISSQELFDGRKIMIDLLFISQLIGTEVSEEKVEHILKLMGYGCNSHNGAITVLVPGNRPDVMGPSDIVEDIAKGYGYHNITPVKPQLNLIGEEVEQKVYQNMIREIMIGLGHQEIMSYVVTSNRFYRNLDYRGGVKVENPKSLDFSTVRDRLVPGVLEFLRINRRRNLPQNVFEVGEVIVDSVQHTSVCILKSNSKSSYSEIKQSLQALMTRLGLSNVVIEPAELSTLIEGRSGNVVINGKKVGIIGEVHPETIEYFELKNPVSYAELNLSELAKLN